MKAANRLWGFIVMNYIPIVAMAAFAVIAWAVAGTPCVMQATTGIPCPGCGLTRAVILALGGDFRGAFQIHPLFWMGAAVLLVLPLLMWRFPGVLRTRAFQIIGLSIIVLFLAVYAVRMLHGFPHTPPMVYNGYSFAGRILRMTRWIG